MNDLISRSELIDYFYFGIDDKPIIDGISDRKIINIIKNQPTAYDIDKVVKELESDERHTFDGCINKRYAIQIVKQGGVDDNDVCEWKQNSTAKYKTSCGYKIEEYFDTNACYCKQCGKKIKVVE